MTGIELIAKERTEQIEKHGWTLEHDRQYVNKELVQAADYCLMSAGKLSRTVYWPSNWSTHFRDKVDEKDVAGKLIVAGAFFMAENDRRGDTFWNWKIDELADEIDRLNNL